MDIKTTHDLASSVATVEIPPFKARVVDVQRHAFGFKLVLQDHFATQPGDNIELILDAEAMKTLISAIANPIVLNAVRAAHTDQQKLLTDLAKAQG